MTWLGHQVLERDLVIEPEDMAKNFAMYMNYCMGCFFSFLRSQMLEHVVAEQEMTFALSISSFA